LKALEKKYQDRWQSERLFEVDAPTQEQVTGLSKAEIQQKYPKWFGNYPFPYMNGSLHLGHAFTISKIEFATGYERMLGRRALFPHGFHVTGMPIKVRYRRSLCWDMHLMSCEVRHRLTRLFGSWSFSAKILRGSKRCKQKCNALPTPRKQRKTNTILRPLTRRKQRRESSSLNPPASHTNSKSWNPSEYPVQKLKSLPIPKTG
jgi:hypothetical protein